MKTKALIYCRVSSKRQIDQGNGLGSQEQRCRMYARNKNYEVIKVFPDEAVSGSLFQRPAMHALLRYIDDNPHENYVVIFDDLSRYARDVKVHIQLTAEFQSRGVKRECLNFNFEDSDESEMAELMVAVSNQYQRKSNRRQVIQKMKARLERGYWPFCMPKGLINQKHSIHGNILVRREPYATIYKEAIEKYRDGILPSILDFQAFVNEKYKGCGIEHIMSFSTATETLKELLYAGYLEYPKWNVERRKAQHEGFITIETFEAVQTRLEGRSKPWYRKDYHLDFPLRPFVLCDSCGVPMTGSYHSGRKKRYPHYFCRSAGCKYVWKSIRKEIFENQFENLLSSVKPADELIDLSKDVLLEVWDNRLEIYTSNRHNAQKELQALQEEIDNYTKLAGRADEVLRTVYEDKIRELVKKKQELEQRLKQNFYTDKDFGTAAEKVFDTLKKPMDMWKSDDYNDKRTILLMYFEDKLRYNYETGFGTATLAYPIDLITKNRPQKDGYVEMSVSDTESKNIR